MKKFDIDHIFIEIIIWSLNIKVRIGYESNNGHKDSNIFHSHHINNAYRKNINFEDKFVKKFLFDFRNDSNCLASLFILKSNNNQKKYMSINRHQRSTSQCFQLTARPSQ